MNLNELQSLPNRKYGTNGETKKLQSLALRSNLATLLVLVPFIAMAGIQIYVSENVRNSRDLLVQKDFPVALYSLAMLDELGDMNSNMLEYVLGEQDEKSAYYDNMDEYEKFLSLIPKDKAIQLDINRVTRLIENTTKVVEEKIFSFDNASQARAKQSATEISEIYGWPLIKLLDNLDSVTNTSNTTDEYNRREQINDTQIASKKIATLKAMYQIRLVINALQRHAYNDLEAKYLFFDELLELEQGVDLYLTLYLEGARDATIIEIMRLLSGIRRYGTEMLEQHDVRKFMLATAAIDEIEHYNYKISETILTEVTDRARKNIETSADNLNMVVHRANTINQLTAFAGCVFLIIYLIHIKIAFFRPIAFIANRINAMRLGERNINFKNNSNSHEIHQIVSSLAAFDVQLSELEELRDSQRLQEQESHLAAQRKSYVELEKREQEQREMANELRKVNEDLEQFVHIASHDLREPLMKMSTFGQMLELQLGETLDEKSKELLNIIIKNASTMADLIDDLRALTKIYDSSLESSQVNLESMVHGLLSDHAEKFEGRNSSISVGKLPTFQGYKGLMKQVFDNLIRNALAHGDDKILLIDISSEPKPNGFVIYFTNSSSQRPHNPQRLLQPFVKGSETGGTGMGLAICKKIVDVHNGSTAIDTSVDHRFTVRIELNNHLETENTGI